MLSSYCASVLSYVNRAVRLIAARYLPQPVHEYLRRLSTLRFQNGLDYYYKRSWSEPYLRKRMSQPGPTHFRSRLNGHSLRTVRYKCICILVRTEKCCSASGMTLGRRNSLVGKCLLAILFNSR